MYDNGTFLYTLQQVSPTRLKRCNVGAGPVPARMKKAALVLKNIAGKYRIIRFELGSADELWNLICHQIDLKFQEWGIHYSIAADNKPDMYKDKLMRMMAQFEAAFPDKGLMIVIDEMLSY